MSNKIAIIDIKSVPNFLDLEKLKVIYKKTGFILWDSSLGGSEPKIIDLTLNSKIIDISIKDN